MPLDYGHNALILVIVDLVVIVFIVKKVESAEVGTWNLIWMNRRFHLECTHSLHPRGFQPPWKKIKPFILGAQPCHSHHPGTPPFLWSPHRPLIEGWSTDTCVATRFEPPVLGRQRLQGVLLWSHVAAISAQVAANLLHPTSSLPPSLSRSEPLSSLSCELK